jgi:hypothetical protein
MSDPTLDQERQKRRLVILEGISQDINQTEIAAQLGVSRWVIKNDIKYMRINRDSELKRAIEGREQVRAEKRPDLASASEARFKSMTGMTLKEKSFRNMIDFYKPSLKVIMKAKDQNAAIMKLPKSARGPLVRNGIITKGWHGREITSDAREYIEKK